MNGRKTIVGLCMLCALLVSAFAAQGASAITGTTAVTCKKGAGDTGGATFNEAHCRPSSPAGELGHYKIAENTTTEVLVRSGAETTKMKVTLGGVATTFTSTELEGAGTMENKVDPSGEHYAHGTVTLALRNVTVSPFTKCFVYTDDGTGTPGAKGVIDANEMTATTTGQGMGAKLEPVNEAKVFTRFWILDKNKVGLGGECTIQGTYTVSGSIIHTPEGATTVVTHTGVTEQNTFKMGTGESPVKAGIEGSLTLEGSAKGAKAFNPLALTTYST